MIDVGLRAGAVDGRVTLFTRSNDSGPHRPGRCHAGIAHSGKQSVSKREAASSFDHAVSPTTSARQRAEAPVAVEGDAAAERLTLRGAVAAADGALDSLSSCKSGINP